MTTEVHLRELRRDPDGVASLADRDEALGPAGHSMDITREPVPHLAFGHGIHHCVGAPLARLLLRMACLAVLRRFPGLRICVSDGGGAAPFLAGRMRQAALKRPWSPDWLREEGAFERELRKLWYDTNVGDENSLELLAKVMGTGQLVMGTNFAGWDQQESIKKGATLPGLADNARRLLGPRTVPHVAR